MNITITAERPDTPDATLVVGELDLELEPLYARESRHGYSVDRLVAEGVDFFVLRCDGVPAGCGGITFEPAYAEMKRMFVRRQFRGMGLSMRMLDHLTAHALERGTTLLRLETGIHQHAAIALYEGAGFQRVLPFGAYREDPVSLCYEKRLQRISQ